MISSFTPHLKLLTPIKLILLMSSSAMFLTSMALLPTGSTVMIYWPLTLMNSTPLSITLIMDPMNTLFSFTIFFISFNVFSFANLYMHNTKSLAYFYHLLFMFVLTMNLLIFTPNLMMMMLGWDGLGITSFLLVIFYHSSPPLAGGMLTALTNRFGDTLMILAIAFSMTQGHWLSSSSHQTPPMSYSTPLLILMATMTKSAQYPFSAWLPAAMAAPTPVSSLVHSSTLVTAGVFLLLRFHSFLSECPSLNHLLLLSSALTSCFMSVSATIIMDTKKIVALSTTSQLGLMMFTLSQNMPFLAFFHLTTHAMFKALLFMSVGLSMMMSHHQQNTYHKRMNTRNRINSTFMMIAILSLTAIPFMGAFLSKDPILEITIYNPPHLLPTLMVMLGATLTVSYSMRLFRSSIYKHSTSIINHTSTFPQCHMDAVLLPLILQSLASVMVPPTFLLTYSYFLPPMNLPPSDHFTPLLMIVLGYLLVDSKSKLNLILPTRPTSQYVSPSQTTSHTLFLTSSFPKILHPPSFKFSLTSLQLIDNGWLELWGPQLTNHLINYSSSALLNFQSNPLPNMLLLSSLTMPILMLMPS